MSSPSILHLTHLAELLRQELHYEEDRYNHSLTAEHISGRLHDAHCHYPTEMRGDEYNALNQLLVTIAFEVDPDQIDNNFEPGRAVQFFYIDNHNELHTFNHPCFVDMIGEGAMRIHLPERGSLLQLHQWYETQMVGVMTCVDTTSYRVMADALNTMISTTDEHLIHLREVLIGQRSPAYRTLPHVSLPWLNAMQRRAVQRVLEAREVAIVHGPPGTGKTTTLVEAVIETLAREEQVMVAAPSNAAVDWISEQLVRRGVPVLRVGNPLRMSAEMQQCSYEQRYADHPDYPELWSIRRMLRSPEMMKGKSREKQAHLRKLRSRQVELEIKINTDLFNNARVVSCTLVGSAYHILEHKHFSTLFIDEAAQALEPACWAAISKCARVMFGGDYCQLPPTVKSPEALRGGLARTLMQQVATTKSDSVTLLTTQYRMNEAIMRFSSHWFYHDRLQAAPEVADRLVSLMDQPLTWIDTSAMGFGEHQNSRNASRSNAEEARMLVQTLRQYVEMIGMSHLVDDNVDFGIISPYRAQVRVLRRMVRSQRFLQPIRKNISVHTIDGFQGQERDVIIISMVRDNDQNAIGFLHDLRRMNVAITRARMKLIVVGNVATLSHHDFYSQLIEHFEQYGEVVTPQPSVDDEQ